MQGPFTREQNVPEWLTLPSVSEPFREGRSMGCGAVIGLVVGLIFAERVTVDWAPPGVWYEWPLAIAVVVGAMIVAGWAVGRWGTTAIAALVSPLSWC
jgi:hypothetical protein